MDHEITKNHFQFTEKCFKYHVRIALVPQHKQTKKKGPFFFKVFHRVRIFNEFYE